MKMGDVATVRVTGRRARIVDEPGGGFYAIEYLPDSMSDPMDRDQARGLDGCAIGGRRKRRRRLALLWRLPECDLTLASSRPFRPREAY